MASTTAAPPTTETPRTVDVKDARARFDEMLSASGRVDARVVIERDGVPIGALVTPGDLRRLRHLDKKDAEFDRVLSNMRAAFADVPSEEIEREIEKALAEIDAERAARRARGEVLRGEET